MALRTTIIILSLILIVALGILAWLTLGPTLFHTTPIHQAVPQPHPQPHHW